MGAWQQAEDERERVAAEKEAAAVAGKKPKGRKARVLEGFEPSDDEIISDSGEVNAKADRIDFGSDSSDDDDEDSHGRGGDRGGRDALLPNSTAALAPEVRDSQM